MARISLSSAINANYIRKLASAANSDTPAQSFKQASRATNIDISAALRFGARVYSQGLKNLNSGISMLNIASFTMEKLTKITEDVVKLMERATAPGTGDQTRRRINSEFRDLATKFKKAVSDAKIGDYKVLDVSSLTEFFTKIGLDPKQSSTIADVFNKFLTRPLDSLLATEKVDNSKQVKIPASAYTTNQIYSLTKSTDSELFSLTGAYGFITSVNKIFSVPHLDLGGEEQVIVEGESGTVRLGENKPVSLLAVQNQSGYSVISSEEDLLGFNGGGERQLFLVAPDGTVAQQLTNFSTGVSSGIPTGVAISSDGKTAIYTYFDLEDSQYKIQKVLIGNIGEDPSLSSRTLIEQNASGAYTSLIMNNEGTYAGYIRSDTGAVYLRDNGGSGAASLGLTDYTNARSIGFLSNNKIAVTRSDSGDSSTADWSIVSVTYNSMIIPDPTNIAQNLRISAFSTLQSSGSNYYSFIDNGQLRVYSGGTLLSAHTFGSTDSFNNLSMAIDSNGIPKVGVAGVIRSFNGDTDVELYSFEAGIGQSGRAKKWDEIFDSARTMVKKADAFQLLADAKDLLMILKSNKETLDQVKDIIISNAELLRTAGLAFLSVAGSLKGKESPEEISFRLQSLIRQGGRGALSQLENLEPLTVKALLKDD